jgi:hypothetical protein
MGRRPPTHEELQDATAYLKKAGWHSTNHFILNHFNSNTPASASQSLRLQPKSISYAPDDIMAAL